MTKKELKESLKALSKYATEQSFTKNYADMAVEYRKQVKYIVRKDDEEHVVGAHSFHPPKCSMCKKNKCTKVFFPCQHACVCDECLQTHNIGILNRKKPYDNKWNACPICVEEIKYIGTLTNTSQEDYYHWLHEVKPPIPFINKKQFNDIGQTILRTGNVPNENHLKPLINIGDWLSNTDVMMDQRQRAYIEMKNKRQKEEEERRRRRDEKGNIGHYRGCCVLS
jgi:hypothetical protein